MRLQGYKRVLSKGKTVTLVRLQKVTKVTNYKIYDRMYHIKYSPIVSGICEMCEENIFKHGYNYTPHPAIAHLLLSLIHI